MRTKWRGYLFGIAVAMLMAASAIAGDAAGKAAYDKQCASCHGADGTGNASMAKAFGDAQLNIVTPEIAGKKDDELVRIIAEGRGKMPAAGKALSSDEQKAVVAYVKSLAK